MKVKVEIDVEDIFDNTTAAEDKKILRQMVERCDDATLVDEVISRELFEDVLRELSEDQLREMLNDFGYELKE